MAQVRLEIFLSLKRTKLFCIIVNRYVVKQLRKEHSFYDQKTYYRSVV